MAKIRSRYDAFCSEPSCGAFLPAGTLVRYYGRNGIYGVHCHTKSESTQGKHSRFRESKQKREMEETFGTPCGHEDYPCCGCSDRHNQIFG